jgi:hypothetical protein
MSNYISIPYPRLLALQNQIKELQAAIAKRDSMVEEMNTATVEFIDAYCGMEDYLLHNEEVEA